MDRQTEKWDKRPPEQRWGEAGVGGHTPTVQVTCPSPSRGAREEGAGSAIDHRWGALGGKEEVGEPEV